MDLNGKFVTLKSFIMRNNTNQFIKGDVIKLIKELKNNRNNSFCTKCMVFFENDEDDPCYKPLEEILDKLRKTDNVKEIDILWDKYMKLNKSIGRDDYVIDNGCYECPGEFNGAIQILKLMFNIVDDEVEDDN